MTPIPVFCPLPAAEAVPFSGRGLEELEYSMEDDRYECSVCGSIVKDKDWHYGYECCMECFLKGDF